jgi:hypothetical protein
MNRLNSEEAPKVLCVLAVDAVCQAYQMASEQFWVKNWHAYCGVG